MHSSISLTSLIIGLVVGVTLGRVYQATRQHFLDLRNFKNRVKITRRVAWASVPTVAGYILIASTCLAIAILWVVRDQTDHGPTPLLPTSSAEAK